MVLANIEFPPKSEKIRLYLEQPEDITALDLDFGSGVRIQNQFDLVKAWCLGSSSNICPTEGFKRDCTKKEREAHPNDC